MMEVPLCKVCRHPHELGVKCSICGHTGPSTIYAKMCARAAEKSKFRVEFYVGNDLIRPDNSTSDTWDIIEECRNALYCERHNIPVNHEFQSDIEKSSIHMIGWLGDMPIAVARYNLNISDSFYEVIIDRFGILPLYTNCGYTVLCYEAINNDIMIKLGQTFQRDVSNTKPNISIEIPVTNTSGILKICNLYQINPATNNTQTVDRGGVAFARIKNF